MNLEQAGYGVLGPAASAVAAFTLCEERGPDAALLDVKLDGAIDGIVLGRELAERGVAVIYLTGYFDRAVFEGREHAAGLLRKPFAPQDLERMLEQVLDGD